ncbi:CynX/NimT family MFS transporter [Novosphingobium sp. 9]|uniref:MFS transporter n=1 Tax=Novosphingobium sp. 9 TaxID=2025349 RepID=UPI0021B3B247|nr:MFS transporter [Novosphingobium sp. 9]
MPRSTLVMFAASLGFFFVTATTFTSLGYELYTMAPQLGWSQAAAGFSFSLLGLACGLGSPLVPVLMKTIGSRLTMVAGSLVLSAGFFIAASVHSLALFYVATTLMGVGFSLVAPAPAVDLLANWYGTKSDRMIGFYFMFGAAGGIAGPQIVNAIFTATGDWRLNWSIMGVGSLLLALVCLLCVRDRRVEDETAAASDAPAHRPSAWTVRMALRSPAFLLIATIITVVQMAVTSLHSLLVTHIAHLDGSGSRGALAMSLIALAGAGAKGVTGSICEKVDPKAILVVGLGVQTCAMLALWATGSDLVATGAAMVFGLGWGLAWLSAHILILRYFGPRIAGDMVAMATTATTVAVLGPVGAGRVADVTGSYAPALLVFAILLGITMIAALLFLRAPKRVNADAPADGESLGEALSSTMIAAE